MWEERKAVAHWALAPEGPGCVASQHEEGPGGQEVGEGKRGAGQQLWARRVLAGTTPRATR